MLQELRILSGQPCYAYPDDEFEGIRAIHIYETGDLDDAIGGPCRRTSNNPHHRNISEESDHNRHSAYTRR